MVYATAIVSYLNIFLNLRSSMQQAMLQYIQYIRRGTHGSIKYGLIRVLFFKRELRIADHYLRPLSEFYINI